LEELVEETVKLWGENSTPGNARKDILRVVRLKDAARRSVVSGFTRSLDDVLGTCTLI
jgi:hypothetical protein